MYDVQYGDDPSLRKDLHILLRTIPAALLRRGALWSIIAT